MNKILAPFSLGRPVLISYVPAGDPKFSKEILDSYLDGGSDILEIGLPSNDPYMDGEIMGSSMKRSHAAGTDGDVISRVISQWLTTTKRRPALLWMCYSDADLTNLEIWAKAGTIDGILMLGTYPDGLEDRLTNLGLALTVFIPWDYTPSDEILAKKATGYIMVPTRPGRTGAGSAMGDPSEIVRKMRKLNPNAPVVAGFGVSDANSALQIMDSGVDGVVVGTACIDALFKDGSAGLRSTLQKISQAIQSLKSKTHN